MIKIVVRTQALTRKFTAAAVFLSFLVSTTEVQSRDEFKIDGLRCERVRCTTAEGIMPRRLTTVEITGEGATPGGRLQLMVSDVRQQAAILDRSFGVFAAGNFSASIPAYRLDDGRYSFVITANRGSIVGSGSFSVSSLDGADSRESASGKSRAGPLKKVSPLQVTGTWHGINGTVATVELRGNGTYLWSGSNAGSWQRNGDEIVFTGSLAAWNQGRGKLNSTADLLEFYWTNREGAKQYFVLQKYP